MKYLDKEQLAAIDCKSFRARTPYPWCNPTGILTEEGFAELTGNMPEVEQFRGFFGKERKHGIPPYRLAEGTRLTPFLLQRCR